MKNKEWHEPTMWDYNEDGLWIDPKPKKWENIDGTIDRMLEMLRDEREKRLHKE